MFFSATYAAWLSATTAPREILMCTPCCSGTWSKATRFSTQFFHGAGTMMGTFGGDGGLSKVPNMVPAPWKNWVENIVALLQVPEQHGVPINISLGAVVAE